MVTPSNVANLELLYLLLVLLNLSTSRQTVHSVNSLHLPCGMPSDELVGGLRARVLNL